MSETEIIDAPMEEIVESGDLYSDLGDYVEDGYGQLTSSNWHVWAVTFYGILGLLATVLPWVLAIIKPEWVVGSSSLDFG